MNYSSSGSLQEGASWCTSKPANRTELTFRALLTEGGAELFDFVRA